MPKKRLTDEQIAFERRQIDAVRQELNAEYETANVKKPASQQARPYTAISSNSQTLPRRATGNRGLLSPRSRHGRVAAADLPFADGKPNIQDLGSDDRTVPRSRPSQIRIIFQWKK